MTGEPWVVLYKPDGLWWRAKRSGYSSCLLAAGVYTEAEAKSCEETRGRRPNGEYLDEAMPLSEAIERVVGGEEAGTVRALLLVRCATAPKPPADRGAW